MQEANPRSRERARSRSTRLCGRTVPPPTMASKQAPPCSDRDNSPRRSLAVSLVSWGRVRRVDGVSGLRSEFQSR